MAAGDPGASSPSEVTTLPPVDRPTIAAIAALVYSTGAVIHEIAGHGSMCLLSGGATESWSSVHFGCSVESLAVMAGGTLANVVAGLLFLAAYRVARGAATATRYALWLAATLNLMQAAGYFLFSGVLGIGDWAAVLRHFGAGGVARAVMAASGMAVYLVIVALAARGLGPFLPSDRAAAERAARPLTLFPWIVGGILSCVAGALNPVGFILVAISAAAASFGGTSGLAWMASIVGTSWAPLEPGEHGLAIPRHRGYLLAGLLAAILFIAVLGPGSGGG
ncbi:MAG TPA: hypothetical protein VJV75_06835 [Candidatus Polarisedimenticolia bacterium]|nr:hypothetical protein [Candidatus Polarisedimenticolia bacterium]